MDAARSNYMQRTKWLDRRFNFDFPAGLLENVIVRLNNTLPGLKQMVLNLSDKQLIQKPDAKWSVKEHIGHLAGTENLHEGRIDDILAGKKVLRPAFVKKPESEKPDYNREDILDLLHKFEVKRQRFILRLEDLDDETQNSLSLHPRLQVMMRPVDIALFAAEHDDHHLASIREIIKDRRQD